MQYIVVKDLPNGQRPDSLIDLPESIGALLVNAGLLRRASETTAQPLSERRRYRRRDVQAEAS